MAVTFGTPTTAHAAAATSLSWQHTAIGTPGSILLILLAARDLDSQLALTVSDVTYDESPASPFVSGGEGTAEVQYAVYAVYDPPAGEAAIAYADLDGVPSADVQLSGIAVEVFGTDPENQLAAVYQDSGSDVAPSVLNEGTDAGALIAVLASAGDGAATPGTGVPAGTSVASTGDAGGRVRATLATGDVGAESESWDWTLSGAAKWAVGSFRAVALPDAAPPAAPAITAALAARARRGWGRGRRG